MRGHCGFGAGIALALGACSFGASEPEIEIHIVEVEEIELLPTEARFVSVQDMALSAESIWILDGAPPFVTRFSLQEGATVRFGSEGKGPGEFLSPRAIQPGHGTHTSGVWVWDLGNGRVTTYDRDGELVGSARLSDKGRIRARSDIRDVSYADPFRIRSIGAGITGVRFPQRVNHTADVATGSLWRGDSRLEPEVELAKLSDHMDVSGSNLREWAALPLWDACDGMVVLWSPGTKHVLWLEPEGRVTTSIPIDMPSIPLGLRDIETHLRWMGRLELGPDYEKAGINFASMARANRDRFADWQPLATDLRCETGGTAWLRLFDTSYDPLGRSQTWLSVSKNEAPMKVQFPEEFSPFAFTREAVYGMYEAPEGYQRLARWVEGSID